MNLWPLRTLALQLNLSAHGVAATVTRPEPDDTPIVTTAIWLAPREDAEIYGTEFQHKAPRRILALPRSDVPTLPRGTVIAAAESTGGPVRTWQVEHLDRAVEQDHWRAAVTLVVR